MIYVRDINILCINLHLDNSFSRNGISIIMVAIDDLNGRALSGQNIPGQTEFCTDLYRNCTISTVKAGRHSVVAAFLCTHTVSDCTVFPLWWHCNHVTIEH